MSGGEHAELVNPPDPFQQRGRGNAPADLEAGHAKRLAGTAQGHGALSHARQRRQPHVRRPVIQQVLIDLIDDGDGVPLLAQPGDDRQFLPAEDLACRVVRGVDQDRPRPRVEGPRQFIRVKRPARGTQPDVARHGPGHLDVGHVGVEERLEDDDLIAGIHQTQHREEHAQRCPGNDQHVRVRIDGLPVMAAGVLGDRPAQGGRPDRRRIPGRLAGAEGLHRRLDDSRRRVKIRRALPQVDRPVPERQGVNLGKDARPQVPDAVGHLSHAHHPQAV